MNEKGEVHSSIESWHKEEYKLLSNHYFHEDNYYLKGMTIFLTLNAALLAIRGANFVVPTAFEISIGIPAIGMIASILWFFSLVRIRYLRTKIESRIEVIEKLYSISATEPEGMLSIRNRIETKGLHSFPVSIAMRGFPIIFFIIWLVAVFASK